MNIRNRNRCSWLSIITNRISSRYIILYDYKSYYNRYDLSMIFIPIIIFLNMENIDRPSREKRYCPAEWWADSVKKIGVARGYQPADAGGDAADGRKRILAELMPEVKMPAKLSKLFPWYKSLPAACSVGCFSDFCPQVLFSLDFGIL